MKRIINLMVLVLITLTGCAQTGNKKEKEDSRYFRPLTRAEERVIVNKGTERPYTGKYEDFWQEGVYVCKRCGAELYRSSDKFNAQCGWPSFDDEIPGAVTRTPDPDGMRTEITCTNCGAHLGHVFTGEGFTPKNTRHCVNSISLVFVPAHPPKNATTDTAIFAGGCFWGVEYYMEKAPGVIDAVDGYIGGHIKNPTYEEVCSHTTGFAEAVEIVYDPKKTDYETLAKLFFEIHDPTQLNRQGPDIGDQYRSEIFYRNMDQKKTAEKLIGILKDKGYNVVTKLTPATKFYKAEDYHQDHYDRKGGKPYCHGYTKRF
ncbi:bifunctional methionine sulfoxide reductase B/A protein [Saccharicrinis sp. FJH62]|uniref:bifunctional methionine sulfoxide reductase B/A protein n=1 Tax=Saccharicrinis sp. FJH62 TaxID=3344657 RepID=UPI0035D452DB